MTINGGTPQLSRSPFESMIFPPGDELNLPRLADGQPDLGQCSDPELQAALLENLTLREQIATQTQLLQLMTHQLATPLTSLSGALGLLTEADLSADHRQEFLDQVRQDIERMRHLLADLGAIRHVETGKLQTRSEPLSIIQIVTEVMQGFANCPVIYHFEPSLPLAWGDRWQTFQVLVNLISNAVKYSPAGCSLEVGATQIHPDWLEVWVRDHGLGIPAADQPYIFERFYRVKHGDRHHIQGTGLGLALCKLLVENQGGQLGFESTHGEGSRFFFTLPTRAR